MSVSVRVPAKINLALRVGERRADGYHELSTVFQAVGLYDTLTAARAPALTASVSGEGCALVPTGEGNLALRAARLLQVRTGVREGAELHVAKAIPVAGGLAGGSADAAAALVACDALWQTGLVREDLLALAAELGSDVPFAVHGGTALGTGRGCQLTEVLARGRYYWVLVLAERGLATPEVFALHDDLAPRPRADVEAVLAALRSGDPAALGRALGNDLQAAALRLRPELDRVLSAGVEAGALGVVVSGSGPTVAMLAASGPAAVRLAAEVAGCGWARAVRTAEAPVAGARLVTMPG